MKPSIKPQSNQFVSKFFCSAGKPTKKLMMLLLLVILAITPAWASEKLFVADSGNGDVRLFNIVEPSEEGGENAEADEGAIADGAFEGVYGETADNLSDPRYLAFHPATDNLFVSDTGNDDIREFTGLSSSESDPGFLTISHNSTESSGTFVGVFGNTADNLNDPRGIAFHPDTENLFVSESDSGSVKQFDSTSGLSVGIFGETSANLQGPRGIAFHPTTGNLFVADETNGDVREFDGSTGTFVGVFGETIDNLSSPQAIAFHPDTESLLVADSGNGDIREFEGTSGDFIGVFGETSNNMNSPLGLAIHSTGSRLFGSDTGNDDVRDFGGTNGTFAGVFGESAANLSNPFGMAISEGDDGPLPARALKVTPSADKKFTGFSGGSFKPPNHKYRLHNKSSTPINYLITKNEDWLDIDGDTSGTIQPGEKTDIFVMPNEEADSLEPGIYTDTLNFLNTTNGVGDTQRTITLLVGGDKQNPVNLPKKKFNPVCLRGKCNNFKENFEVTNFGEKAVNFAATASEDWLNLAFGSPDGNLNRDQYVAMADLPVAQADTVTGTVRSGETVGFTATVNSSVEGTTSGDATITVTNTDNNQVIATDTVSITFIADPFRVEHSSRVASPYWQSDGSTYTFLAVSHPSLSGMSSQVGVIINAFKNDGAPFGAPAEFTVGANSTQRVFIVGTNNAVINPTNVPTGKFIVGTTSGSHGQLVITPVSEDIELLTGNSGSQGRGYPDVTMLNLWGAVVVQSTSTGFAMEFVGDNQDSRALNSSNFSGVN